MVEKGTACVKYLLFAFNLIFFLFGAVLIGVGAYAQIEISRYMNFSGPSINSAAILIIIVGVVTLIVGFFGCCGAFKENHCMVMTFAVLIGIILICEIGAGIAGYVLRGKLRDLLSKGMKESFNGYNNSDAVVKDAWDKLQAELKCCGVNNASDWSKEGIAIPGSCCGSTTACNETQVYPKGCLPGLEDNLKANIGIVAGAAVGLAVVELIGIILACCLARGIRSEYEVA